MTKRNRESLKKYFQNGSRPSGNAFEDLIDSMLNIIDEGFDKSPENGLKIYPIGESEKYIGFFDKINMKSPVWSIDVDKKNNNLIINNRDEEPVISLNSNCKVGINKKNPLFELDVDGVISAKGRIGNYKHGQVPADGESHDIIKNLTGCHAFEIIAGAGRKKSGRYSLIHAFAINTFNGSSKIKPHLSHYGDKCNRLELYWKGNKDNYSLKIKSCCDYEENTQIQYYITQLWFDPSMEGSSKKESWSIS